MKRLIATMTVALLAASCADQPTAPVTERGPAVDGVVLSLVEHLAQNSPTQNTPTQSTLQGPQITLLAVVVDPLDPNTVTYTFDDLPGSCFWSNAGWVMPPNPYEDLAFANTPYWATCTTPNGTIGFVPNNAGSSAYEVLIDLPEKATFASLDTWDIVDLARVTLTGYDANGGTVASATSAGTWPSMGTVSIQGTGIVRLGVAVPQQAWNYLDNLTVTYDGDPETREDCMKGGWVDYGFRNQGQCIRFVETGKDSR